MSETFSARWGLTAKTALLICLWSVAGGKVAASRFSGRVRSSRYVILAMHVERFMSGSAAMSQSIAGGMLLMRFDFASSGLDLSTAP